MCASQTPQNVRAQYKLLRRTCVHILKEPQMCVHSVAAPPCTCSRSLCGLWRRVGRRPRDLCSRPNLLLQMMTSSGNRANVNPPNTKEEIYFSQNYFFPGMDLSFLRSLAVVPPGFCLKNVLPKFFTGRKLYTHYQIQFIQSRHLPIPSEVTFMITQTCKEISKTQLASKFQRVEKSLVWKEFEHNGFN